MKFKKLKLIKFNDPGHGWLRVKRQLLVDLGIASQISGYSYQRGSWVYLEEDMDVGTFIRALAWANGYKASTTDGYQAVVQLLLDVKYKHNNNGSKIRNYDDYKYNGEVK